MQLTLPPDLEKFVKSKVESGLYTTADEVIQESLRLMHAQDKFNSQQVLTLNESVKTGLSQLKNGDRVDGKASHHKMKQKINRHKGQ